MATKTKKPEAEKPSKGSKSKLNLRKANKAKTAARKMASKTKVRMTRAITRKNAAQTKLAKKAGTSRWKVKPLGHAPHSARISSPKGEMQPIASKTEFAPKYNSDRKWLIVDVANQTVGRVASQIANLLRGKHKSSFTPNNDAGDFVIVINAEKVKFTSNKEETKQYFNHSGWIGGLKITTPARLRKDYPERIIEKAVKGMVPRNPLGRDQMRKLKNFKFSNTDDPSVYNIKVNLRTL